MNISNVTKEDGIALATLLNGLKVARFDGVTGNDMDSLYKAKRWLGELATVVAGQLKASSSVPAAAPAGGFKVKSMGPLPGKLKTNKKSK